MELTINIEKYLSDDEIKNIAQDAVFAAIREQLSRESEINRIITNLTYEYVFDMVDNSLNQPLIQLIRDRVKEFLEKPDIGFYIFRRKDAWEKSESPAVAILDEELKNSRPLIRAAVEKHIAEYPFHELDRDEIGNVIYDVIMERILKSDEKEKVSE